METQQIANSPLSVRRHKSLSQGLVENITNNIKNAVFKPGEKLPTESAIMQLYGVSRTVVREAISHLQAAGLVQTRHGIGTFILEPVSSTLGISREAIITVRDVLDILELRISLETEAAWLAASRRTEAQLAELATALNDILTKKTRDTESVNADVRFHLLIAQATGNRYFVDILSDLGTTIIPRARLNSAALNLGTTSSYIDKVNHEHEDIYSAILRKDPEAARAAMRTHLSNSRERLRQAQLRMEEEASSGQAENPAT
ncbi:FadR family transcriptional regulator [Undibacterium sp. CY18W]|uniref:FadR family transcriptional regulator n=1 Tax=Undibacterium hunanense TaxID=2762292 RepID=A0ABR6ZNI2_9BURK|nr:FadR/GntR family transcriptional regulator [Undibacterium hunanense]MBC3917010.1 FadR family transcriptional regulator [Undibacterium hunanense]